MRSNKAARKSGNALLVFSIALGVAALFFLAFQFLMPQLSAVSFEKEPAALVEGKPEEQETPPAPKAAHLPTPAEVKAIYMSQCVVGTPNFRKELVELIDTTELNAVIIDIKDYTGKISFTPDDPSLAYWVSDACGARDMRSFIEMLHEKGIYVIGRVTVFQDPTYTKAHPELAVQSAANGVPWKDRKGLAFVQVGAKPYWEEVVKLAKASYAVGFDEINFDYIRFPSDGNMADARYTLSPGLSKQEALEEFFKYLHDNLKDTGMKTSADLFGMTTTNTDDLNIGQVLERALPYFDYIYPMVYPSHYPAGFNGWKDPNAQTYALMKYVLDAAVRRTESSTASVDGFTHTRIGTSTPAVYEKPVYDKQKIRPWLQDFDYPVDYTPTMVANQIQATKDAGLTGYLFWDPGNKYSSLRQVLKSE
jgi:hypothetical protein